MTEFDEAVYLAKRILERPYADPDDNLAMLSRQFLRQVEAKDAVLSAVKEHHSQKADDRCWMDDDKLYAACGLRAVDRRVGDKQAMLENCKRFIDRRYEGGHWPTYAELEAEVARLKAKDVENAND